MVFTATHPNRGQLEVTLTSPAGTQSVLAATRTNDASANYSAWTFGTVRDWDEASAGNWTLSVKDNATGPLGTAQTFTNWRLRVYGTEITSDTPGPRVAGITSPNANGMVNGGSIQSFRVQFDQPINPITFTPDDITFQRVGGAATAVSQILPVNGAAPSDTTFDVTLTSPVSEVGNYRVDIGPNIADPAGTPMNQDGDLTNGEVGPGQVHRVLHPGGPVPVLPGRQPGVRPPLRRLVYRGRGPAGRQHHGHQRVGLGSTTSPATTSRWSSRPPATCSARSHRDATPPGSRINGNGFGTRSWTTRRRPPSG